MQGLQPFAVLRHRQETPSPPLPRRERQRRGPSPGAFPASPSPAADPGAGELFRLRGAGASFDLRRFARDRQRLAALLAARESPGAVTPRGVPQRLLAVASRYGEVARRLGVSGAARDMTQLLGWTRQAAQAVSPRYREAPPRPRRRFQQFVQVSVVLVVLLEDPGETFHGPGMAEFEGEVRRAARRHLDAPGRGGRRAGGAEPPQPPPLRLYLEALDMAFALFWDLVAELCPRFTADPAGARTVERLAVGALWEVLSALDFSRRFDALCRGRRGGFLGRLRCGTGFPVSLRELPLDAYLEANQANIFMRCMLDLNFLQFWDHLPAPRRAALGDFSALFREIDRLGAGIERLGNMSNDLATLFREIGEGFVSNFVLADGVARGFLRPELLSPSFTELQERIDPEARKKLLKALAEDFFAGREREACHGLRARHPELPATARLLEALWRGDSVRAGVARWRRELDALCASFRHSRVAECIDLDDLWQRQRRFLGQYLGANGMI